MPLETSAVGVRPVGRTAAPGGVDQVGRRNGENTPSGFRPQTNVSIENAIDDMAGILSKIASEEVENVEKMPQDLRKVIENVMRQAFSFDETIGSGLGSTMESQRFSMEQLTTVARTLLQMSSLAEKGYDVGISDGLQKLLSQLKRAVTQEPGGQAFEPVLLLKAAFGLINGKDASTLPPVLQQVLASMQTGGQAPTESTAFLKALVQYLMPKAGQTSQNQALPNQTLPGQAFQGLMQGQAMEGAPTPQAFQGQGQAFAGTPAQPGAQGQAFAGTPAQMQGMPEQAFAGTPTQQGAQGQASTGPAMQGQAFQEPTLQGTLQQGTAQQGTAQGQPLPTQGQMPGATVPSQTQGSAVQTPLQGQMQEPTFSNPTQGQMPETTVPSQTQGQMQNPALQNSPQQGQMQGQALQTPSQGPMQGQAPQNSTQGPMQGQAFQNPTQGQPLPGQALQEPVPQTPGQAVPGQNAQAAQGQAGPQGQMQGQTMPSQMQGQPLAGQMFEEPMMQGQGQPLAGQAFAGQAQGNPASGQPMPLQGQATTGQSGPMPQGSTVPGQTGQMGQTGQTASGERTFWNAPDGAASQNPQAARDPQTMAWRPFEPAPPQALTAREAKELLMQQPMQNTPESMQTMKDLAKLFLEKGTVAPQDAPMLQAFADGKEATLSTKEARKLETLLRLVQQNIPATVQQAAVQNDMPDLSRLWAFMQLCDLAVAKKLTSRQLKKASKDVVEFIFSMRSSMEGDHAIQPGQRSMNFMMPMYLGENEKSYPAYIHVYDETKPDKETGALKKETWLRLCVLTENLGAVELTCRVYEREHLDMRLFFASRDTAQEFRDYVPSLRKSMRGSKLHLEDVAIGAPGV